MGNELLINDGEIKYGINGDKLIFDLFVSSDLKLFLLYEAGARHEEDAAYGLSRCGQDLHAQGHIRQCTRQGHLQNTLHHVQRRT